MVHDLRSKPLPVNQWMIEVEFWFATGLAKLQKAVVDYAASAPNLPEEAHALETTDPMARAMCFSQMVRASSDTISFSVLGLALVLIIGALLLFMNLILDSVVGFIQRRCHVAHHRRLEWTLDEKLQLQRLAYDEAGLGIWSGVTSVVPTTGHGERIGLPTDVDPERPRLRRVEKSSGSSDERHASPGLVSDGKDRNVETTEL
ncbi:MAG: hypothetical protein M1837_004440 [Sclerophora amabilis]|nr:MAG: hypothetical protein M1837_004440 [Sclerophora amabilis]